MNNALKELRGLDMGHYLALVKAFPNGRADVDAVLRGDYEITLQDALRLLFDKKGRCIPTVDKTVVTAAVCDANKNYYHDRLARDFDCAQMLSLWLKAFEQSILISESDYKQRIAALVEMVKSKRHIANVLKGAWYPVLLPKISQGDYGEILEHEFLPAVKHGYERAFTSRTFVNRREGKLRKSVAITSDRHRQLIADMEREQVVGIVCYPLQGFSVYAQRQIEALMPKNFSLLGAIDAAVADALYPLQLSRDNSTPVRDCSGVRLGSDHSLYFRAQDDRLEFDDRYDLGAARAAYSGGFLLRG